MPLKKDDRKWIVGVESDELGDIGIKTTAQAEQEIRDILDDDNNIEDIIVYEVIREVVPKITTKVSLD